MKRQRETAKTEMKGLDWVLPGKTEVETQGREIQVELIPSQLTLGLRATYMFRPKPESCFLFLLRPEDWAVMGRPQGQVALAGSFLPGSLGALWFLV